MIYRISIGKMVDGEWRHDHYASNTELENLWIKPDGTGVMQVKYQKRVIHNILGQEINWEMVYNGRQDVSDTHKVEWGCVHDGIELYENDIVTAPYYLFQDDGKYNYHGLIYYDKESLLFGLGYVLVDKSKAGISDGIGNQLSGYDRLVLLGNRNQNPELLGGQNA